MDSLTRGCSHLPTLDAGEVKGCNVCSRRNPTVAICRRISLIIVTARGRFNGIPGGNPPRARPARWRRRRPGPSTARPRVPGSLTASPVRWSLGPATRCRPITPSRLLPVPPDVAAAVAEDDASLFKKRGIIPTPEDRQRRVNSLTLQYYYGGHDVAYRLTPLGVELLAAGLFEIRQLVQGMGQEELLTIKIGQP
jgi:hypothetical protein